MLPVGECSAKTALPRWENGLCHLQAVLPPSPKCAEQLSSPTTMKASSPPMTYSPTPTPCKLRIHSGFVPSIPTEGPL